jgi:hypothetical protein
MRKAALDIRLVNSAYRNGADSKIAQLVANVAKIWKDTQEQRGTQLVFCDLSVPKGKSSGVEVDNEFGDEEAGDLVVYDEIKKLLIRQGIPAQEIAFIHDAKNQRQKEILKEKVRQGIIRVLIGSTAKMGVGINVQNKLIALHHLDCPWRPRDIEQREGRILRQGNENSEVMIFVYVTRESADAWLWQTVKAKARFINQAMSGKLISRTLSDIEQTTLGYAEIEAIATGNPLIIERVKVDSDVDKYTSLKSKWLADRYAMEDEVARLPTRIMQLEANLSKYMKDIAMRQDTTGTSFKITLEGKEYTTRKEAQSVLDALINYLQNSTSENIAEYEIGTFAGFTLTCIIKQTLLINEVELSVNGGHRYSTNTSMKSLEFIIKNAPDTGSRDTTNALEALKKKLVDLKAKKIRGFEYEEQLQKSVVRQQEIMQLLQIDQKAS